MSKELRWARKQGLDCEQDLMAAQLRVSCFAQTLRVAQTVLLFGIFLVLCIGPD